MACRGACGLEVPVASLLCEDSIEHDIHLSPRSPQMTVFPATFFNASTVFVAISDKTLYNTVSIALECAGSVVCTGSPLLADLVVTNVVDYQFPSLPRSRGYKLAGGLIKYPKVVQLEQLPWIFDQKRQVKVHPEAPTTQKVSKKSAEKMMVVCDDLGRFRPHYKLYTDPVKLYTYKRKVEGLTSCPFNPIPEAARRRGKYVREEKEKIVVLNSPQDKGYCEMCNMSYDIAEEHHASFDHKRNSGDLKWAEFDYLAEVLFKKAAW